MENKIQSFSSFSFLNPKTFLRNIKKLLRSFKQFMSDTIWSYIKNKESLDNFLTWDTTMVPRRRWSPNCWVFVVTEARCQAAARLCLEALRPRENPALVSVLGPRQGHLGLYSGASETLSAWWPGNPAPAPPAITLPLPHCQHYDHQSWYTDEYATTTLRQQQTGSLKTPIPLLKVMFKMHLRQFCVQFCSICFCNLWNSFVFLTSQSLNQKSKLVYS